MFNFLAFLMSLLHSIPFKHAIHFLACRKLMQKKGSCSNSCLLARNAVSSCKHIPTFRRIVEPLTLKIKAPLVYDVIRLESSAAPPQHPQSSRNSSWLPVKLRSSTIAFLAELAFSLSPKKTRERRSARSNTCFLCDTARSCLSAFAKLRKATIGFVMSDLTEWNRLLLVDCGMWMIWQPVAYRGGWFGGVQTSPPPPPPPRNSEDIGGVLDRMSKNSRRLDFLL